VGLLLKGKQMKKNPKGKTMLKRHVVPKKKNTGLERY
jgi:hypothetical protein